jgi:drug/metabolite transporter (DMT)-like permease
LWARWGGSYLAFYGALRIGPISIVSPIVAGYAAVTVLIAVIVLGERLPALEVTAAVVSLLGVVAASADVRALEDGARCAARACCSPCSRWR